MKCSICGKAKVTLIVPPDKRVCYCLSCIHADLSKNGQLSKQAKHVPTIVAWLEQQGHSIPEAELTIGKPTSAVSAPRPPKGRQAKNRSSEERMADSLTKLVTFGRNPRNRLAWDEARIALGDLGDATGGLLASKPQEDVALTSSLTELDGYADRLRKSPGDKDARNGFELSLGDVEYRIKRLFGVSIR